METQLVVALGLGLLVALGTISWLIRRDRSASLLLTATQPPDPQSDGLRTPLASMQLLVETLTREPPPNLARRMLGQIEDELTAMIQLVDELNELAQIESGRLRLNLQTISVAALVDRVIARLHPQAERK